jgi:hypothetical protein
VSGLDRVDAPVDRTIDPTVMLDTRADPPTSTRDGHRPRDHSSQLEGGDLTSNRERNALLSGARLRQVSPSGSGRPMSRQELADAVSSHLARV